LLETHFGPHGEANQELFKENCAKIWKKIENKNLIEEKGAIHPAGRVRIVRKKVRTEDVVVIN